MPDDCMGHGNAPGMPVDQGVAPENPKISDGVHRTEAEFGHLSDT